MKSHCIVSLLAAIAFAQPIDEVKKGDGPKPPKKPWPTDIPDLTEGDMILTAEQKDFLFSETRNGVTDTRLRWPGAFVYFWFDTNFSNDERNLVISALIEIQKYTCVRFVMGANSENHYIRVTKSSSGCFAYVGYLRAAQQLNLGNGCMHFGIIIHEFLHALGFYHEQSTYNRDDYVYIHMENVIPGQEHNFNKYTNQQVSNFGVGYDYSSIMHYGAYSFSKNGWPTITAKYSGGQNMGQRNGLSYGDVVKINRMYNC